MKKFFMFLLLGIFLISFTSAFDWTDNISAYYKLDDDNFQDELNNFNGTNSGTINTSGIIIDGRFFDGGDKITLPTDTYGYVSTQELSVNVWFKTGATGTIIPIINFGGAAGSAYPSFYIQQYNTNKMRVSVNNAHAIAGHVESTLTSASNYNDNDWHMITLVANGTGNNLSMYIDGDFETSAGFSFDLFESTNNNYIGYETGSNSWNGSIDELGIWSRALSTTDIGELYNKTPFNFTYTFSPNITLESPVNATIISDVGTNFTVSGNNLSSIAGEWDNITYYVLENSTLVNQTTVSVSGETFNETLFIDDFTRQVYEWNAESCYTNVTGTYCINSTNNNTFTVSLYTLVEENYINDTISGTLETFNVSIDLFPGIDLTGAIFYYNGTAKTPNIIAEDNNRFVIVSDYQIPIIIADENTTFFWELEFNTNETENTTSRTQLVRAMFLDNCDVYTNELFNISLLDEQTKTLLNGDIELIYNVLNANYVTIKTYNFSASNVSNTKVCSILNLTEEILYYSTEIRYTSDEYASEFYHIQRAEVSPEMININLYDLNSSDSTEFKITYQDSTFNFVEGAIIQLQRKYISENAYEVVEAPLTSSEGTTVLHIDLDSVKYKATVVKNGVLLDTFDNLVFDCQSELTGECELKLLGDIDPGNEQNYDTSRDFTYSVAESNGSVTVTYSTPSGSPAIVNIILIQTDTFGIETLCNKTVTSSAGSIECTYNTTIGDSYLDLYIYKNGEIIAYQSYIIPEESGLDLLDNNFFIVFILLLSLVGMAVTSPEWIVVNSIITMVIAGSLFLLNGLNFVVGLGSLMWLVIAAAILILKLAKQEDK